MEATYNLCKVEVMHDLCWVGTFCSFAPGTDSFRALKTDV